MIFLLRISRLKQQHIYTFTQCDYLKASVRYSLCESRATVALRRTQSKNEKQRMNTTKNKHEKEEKRYQEKMYLTIDVLSIHHVRIHAPYTRANVHLYKCIHTFIYIYVEYHRRNYFPLTSSRSSFELCSLLRFLTRNCKPIIRFSVRKMCC